MAPAAKRPTSRHWASKINQKSPAGLRLGFRSGLEGSNAQLLERHSVPVIYEQSKIRYAVPLSFHTYTPDFELPNGIYIETKGIWDAKDRAKMLLVRAQYPDLDIRMVFTRSKAPIAKGSKTTMAQFCEKHGIKYADKLIPLEWIAEPGPKVKPGDVLKLGPKGYTGG